LTCLQNPLSENYPVLMVRPLVYLMSGVLALSKSILLYQFQA